MNSKAIAVAVVAVLAVAAVCGMMLVPHHGEGKDGGIDEGRWSLAYIETADLVDDNYNPYKNASACKIHSHTVDPEDMELVLEIDGTGDHAFSGKFDDKEIAGTYNGAMFRFSVKGEGEHPHRLVIEGILKDDGGYVTLSIIKYGSIVGSHIQVCSASYALLVPVGGDNVSPRVDWIETHLPGEHVRSVRHSATDFVERNGQGTDVDVKLEFVKNRSILTLYDIYRDGADIGVQVQIAGGTTADGTALSKLAGNIFNRLMEPVSFSGSAGMSNGRAVYIHHITHMGMEAPEFMEIVYNVPYPHGSHLSPVHLEERYHGDLTVKKNGGVSETIKVDFRFVMYDNTFYSKKESVNGAITWFGEIHGRLIDMVIMTSDSFGRVSGHVDEDGGLHIYGMLYREDGSFEYLDYDLVPLGT